MLVEQITFVMAAYSLLHRTDKSKGRTKQLPTLADTGLLRAPNHIVSLTTLFWRHVTSAIHLLVCFSYFIFFIFCLRQISFCRRDLPLGTRIDETYWISSAFTQTKDYSPKCQFENYSYYGVKLINFKKLLRENIKITRLFGNLSLFVSVCHADEA